ncbi:PREDICTED: uncharacterized protein LOC109461929 [Branchiostoma belcheri]|uniref:Uncharacterized protein LOC109461929 n=1 Tax=Branchiostoma belcheri TaxID=7741 RepID=A0A6P4YAX5_BRABE|nr:PREDICTED: uncharacterized protein LOC109461929 [Branchiostoma belcheri]
MMGKYVDETCYKCGRSLEKTSSHSSVFRRSNSRNPTFPVPAMKTVLVVACCVLLLAGQSMACGKGIELGPKAQCEKRRECEMARICQDIQGHDECLWKPVCKTRLSCKGAPRPPIPFSNK